MATEQSEAPLTAAQQIAREISGYCHYALKSFRVRDSGYYDLQTEEGKLNHIEKYSDILCTPLTDDEKRAVLAFLELSRDNTCADSVRHLFGLLGKEVGLAQINELANIYKATSELRESEEQDCGGEDITNEKLYLEILDVLDTHKNRIDPKQAADVLAEMLVSLCLSYAPTKFGGLAYLHHILARHVYEYEQRESTDNPD